MSHAKPTDTPSMARLSPSAIIGTMSGSLGDRVVSKTRGGLVAKGKPRYKYPKNPAVQAGNARLKAANEAWNAMSVPEAEAWNRYAATLTHHDPLTGQPYAPAGKNILVALTAKFLQANPGAPIPLAPPTGAYVGPNAVVSVSATSGGLSFAASGPTGAGTVVELLIQPLVTPKRSPAKFYKSVGFASFTAGHLTETVPLEAGWYAAAYRFVERATGRATLMQTLGKIEVV